MKVVFNNNEIKGSFTDILMEFELQDVYLTYGSSPPGIPSDITIPADVTIIGDRALTFLSSKNVGQPIWVTFEGDPPILEGEPFYKMDLNIFCDLTNPKWQAVRQNNYGGAYTTRWQQKN